jgi:hypothetical protein
MEFESSKVRKTGPRVISCKLLDAYAGPAKECGPLHLFSNPDITIAPYLSEKPVDAGVFWRTQLDQEHNRRWSPATENRMRELPRVEEWMKVLTLAVNAKQISEDERRKEAAGQVIRIGLASRSHGIRAFDSSKPHAFVEKHWDLLHDLNVVATHQFLIIFLLQQCEDGGGWLQRLKEMYRKIQEGVIDNGAVLETTWLFRGQKKIIYFVRHCRSCANVIKDHYKKLKKYYKLESGSKATMCLNVEAIIKARCTLRRSISQYTQADLGQVRLFSSGQPRAMQTALALISNKVDEEWLRGVARKAGMYTDCNDERYAAILYPSR